jgi:hypothetical protein
MARKDLTEYYNANPEALKWAERVEDNDGVILDEIEDLPATDPRRLVALNPAPLRRVTMSRTGVHLNVAKRFKATLDISTIQRSSASVLPVSQGDPIPLKGLFKKVLRKTAIIERQPDEELEYQYWHRLAAE